MQAVVRDVIVALRRIRTRPVVSAAAIVTLALGIGANVAMFSVAWPVLVAPLPFPDEDRLMLVSLTYPRGEVRGRNHLSVGDYNDLRTAAAFASMAAFNKYTQQLNLTGNGEPEQLEVGSVTAEFFSTLGVRPLVGRLLQSQDAQSSGRVLVLSERTWRQRFGADPAIGGTVLRLDGQTYEVSVWPRHRRGWAPWIPRPGCSRGSTPHPANGVPTISGSLHVCRPIRRPGSPTRS